MKRFIFLTWILIIIPLALSAQRSVKIEKDDFILEKDGFEEAWYNIKQGDKAYKKGGGLYSTAASYYLKAYSYNAENSALNYKLGICSLFGNDKQGALPYFLKARLLNVDIAEDIVLLTGRAYQFRGDYGKAIDFFNMYSDMGLESGKLDPEVATYINECNMAIEAGGVDKRISITNLGETVNSVEDDYSAVVTKDEQMLYFTTRRKVSEKEELQKSDMKWNENIFLATVNGENWADAGPAGEEVATELNESILYVDNENTKMLLYAGWIGNGDIQISLFEKGRWSKPEPFRDETSTPARETSIAFTADEEEIFFTSDAKRGSFGGRDIYSMRRIKKKKWTKPFNLGPAVNSGGNEEAVWASATGDTIWFSSNGHKGFGGYDIFMSVRDDNGTYSEAVNLGMPVNTQWNDLFYRPSRIDRRVAHFSSNRPGGLGGLDIYKVRVRSDLEILSDTISTNYMPE